MAQFERFIHDEHAPYPALVKAALIHVQFETIHPFLDGNGRVGRLLIALILHHSGILAKPLLYLSLFFKQRRDEYYRLLDLVRSDGDWEAWLDFFLEGVEQTATGAVQTAHRLVKMFKDDSDRIHRIGRIAATTQRVFETFRARPILTVKEVRKRTELSFPAAAKGINNLVKLDLAREMTGKRRNRIFVYSKYLSILSEGTEKI
jgi:Fic family protein